jgi:DNA-binding NtrC family response regulator
LRLGIQPPRNMSMVAANHLESQPHGDSGGMIGCCASMEDVRHSLAKVALSNCTVLITGETGTGKEVAAEFIHRSGKRRNQEFVCINCAAIPDSLIESELFGHTRGAFTGADSLHDGLLGAADGGTVFLDEIGDMSLFAQAKILRAIEKKEVCRVGGTRNTKLDLRFIAATNQDLESMTRRGFFRKDLYFRLNVARIQIPPLRERKEDIPSLLEHYCREFRSGPDSPPRFSQDCLRFLISYDWPGNIRELKNLVESLCLEDVSTIERSHLPAHLRDLARSAAVVGDNGNQGERETLISALSTANGNKSEAAKTLRWSRMTLYRKMAKYKLSRAATSDSNHA